MFATKKWLAIALVAGLTACSSNQPVEDDAPTEESVNADANAEAPESMDVEESTMSMALSLAAEGDHRSEENRARNTYRHPVETLEFFGIEADQTVVELSPGRGWYTEVLAPVLTEGTLVAGAFEYDPEDTESYMTRIGEAYVALLAANPDIYTNVEMGIFQPPTNVDIGEPESADLVVSFRSLHGWYNNEILDDAFAAVFDVLKPGGVFGVVAHRAPDGTDPAETSPKGYLSEEFVIETAEAAGFVLNAKSEINANPLDTHDHEHGVWSLPPTLRGGDETAQEFIEIGESDRMTLRFVKP